MSKNIFRPTEIINLTSRHVLDTPEGKPKEAEAVEELEESEYTGPTADDLRREAEAFKSQWESEKEKMIDDAKASAESIIKEAEAAAFEEVKRKSDQAQKIRKEAEDEAARVIADAKKSAHDIESQAGARVEVAEREAEKKGFELGREEGYKEGKAEVDRLVDRLHTIIDRAMDKRAEILEQTETQVIELVLLIAKKVVKVISENQKNVVVSNVAQALRKLKTKSDVIIRVNLSDLQLATDHIKDFVQLTENARKITVVEDTAIDRGGCIIETDFGEIDARISSQLHELEEKILDIAPIRARGKTQ